AVLLRHVLDEVDDAVGVTPFIVVPGHDLEEALFAGQVVLQGGQRIIDRRTAVVNEVRGNEFFGCHAEDILQVGLRGLGQLLVDLLDGVVAGGAEGEVDHRDVGHGNPEGHAGELALGGGENLADGLGGAGGGRDDV